MKQPKLTLSFRETLVVASLLFGLLFGAGNVIFPVSLVKRQADQSGLQS